MKLLKAYLRRVLLCATALPLGAISAQVAIGAQLHLGEMRSIASAQDGAAPQPQLTVPDGISAQIDGVAAKMAEAIRVNRFSKVLVLGAKGPEKESTQLGMILGDAFSASLEKRASGFQVGMRDEVRGFLNSLDANLDEALTDDWKDGICAKLKADAFVMLRIQQIERSKVVVSTFLFKATNGVVKSLAGWKFELPLDDSMRAAGSSAMPTKEAEKKITNPECGYCPRPDFADAKRDLKIKEAIIYLWILVEDDGRVSDAQVVSSTYPNFDADAVRIVRTWRLKPAKNSKGATVAQHVQVVVTYQLL